MAAGMVLPLPLLVSLLCGLRTALAGEGGLRGAAAAPEQPQNGSAAANASLAANASWHEEGHEEAFAEERSQRAGADSEEDPFLAAGNLSAGMGWEGEVDMGWEDEVDLEAVAQSAEGNSSSGKPAWEGEVDLEAEMLEGNGSLRWNGSAWENASLQSLWSGRWSRRRRHHSSGGKVLTLYHQTSREAGHSILQSGFRPGSQGWCGGGIYFATSPQATYHKAIGPDSKQGYIIEAKVNVGRVKHMGRTCDRSMTGGRLRHWGYDSISFNPGDGTEYVVYSGSRIISMRHYG